MSRLGREILATRKVEAGDGSQRDLEAETSLAQCEYLARLAQQIEAKVCLEVGLAYGVSALFICEAIKSRPLAKFISIDLYEDEGFGGIGLLNLRRAGFDELVEFHGDHSHNVLPRLLADGVKVDFAYVDSTKVFDTLMVDAYFISRLLRVGGIMAFDDCGVWPGVRRLARYLSKWPHFRVHSTHRPYKVGSRRRLASRIVGLLPQSDKLVRDDVVSPEDKLGINAACVAFEKLGEDDRDWKWDTSF